MPLNKVTADSIQDGTVVASDIADGTITLIKLQSGLLPSAIANSAALYANSAFATANTSAAAGSYANSAFATANTGTASGSYANSAFAAANNSVGTNLTQNTNISSAASYANAAFSQANTGGVTSIVAGTGISISAATGAVTVTNSLATGVAKAWAQFTGSATAVVNGSFNISSITTTATGYYTIIFTTPMNNANYSALMSGGTVISGTNSSQALFSDNTAASVAPLTTGFTVTTGTAGWGAYANLNWVCIAVFST